MRRAALAWALTLAAGCTHVQTVPGLAQRVAEVEGAYVSGHIVTLNKPRVIDDKHFVYAVSLDPRGQRLAFTHLAGETFNLAVTNLADLSRPVDVPTNEYAFDVEAVAFCPAGRHLATAGRDGALRLFAADSGKLVAHVFAEEPLVSLAFLPDGEHLVVGSARGLLTVYRVPGLAWTSEVRAHTDEVRAIAVADDGTVVTGGWDRSVAVLEPSLAPLPTEQVRLVFFEKHKVRLVRAALDGWSAPFALDAQRSQVVVSEALARQAGIEPALLSESVMVGGHTARLARNRTVVLKYLRVEGVDVAVCDGCLPKGAQGVLGASVLERFELTIDERLGELVLRPRAAQDPAERPSVLTLVERARHQVQAYVNDLSIDRAGRRVGLACSGEKAERNRGVYEREKKGAPAPFHQGDFAAILEVQTGEVLRKWAAHQGVVSTVGISPDGRTLASGGWDRKLYVVHEDEPKPRLSATFGWSVRRVRFSADGRLLAVGAWTPQKVVGNHRSAPSAVVYELGYGTAELRGP
jgi:WD40 repeat protein